MNFFEKQLRSLIGNQPAFENAKYIGRACVTPLNSGVKLKAEFIIGIIADRYEALKLTAINPADGIIDSLTLRFRDYFCETGGAIRCPYIVETLRDNRWYSEPNIAEKAALGDAAQDYVELFEQQEAMEINM